MDEHYCMLSSFIRPCSVATPSQVPCRARRKARLETSSQGLKVLSQAKHRFTLPLVPGRSFLGSCWQ